jgi:cytochrome c556
MKATPLLIVSILVLVVPFLRGYESQKKTQPLDPKKVNELMQEKQKLAHEIFDAIVLKEFKRIAKNARRLVTLSKAAEFQVHKTPRYLQYSLEFREAAEQMAQNARDQNQDGVTLAFLKITLSCVHCHDYIREKPGP